MVVDKYNEQLKADEALTMGDLVYVVDGKVCTPPALVPLAAVLSAEQREQLRQELNALAGREVF